MTGLGALVAAALYLVFEGLDRVLVSGHAALAWGSFIAAAGGVMLLLATRLPMRFAAGYALVIGICGAALLTLCALRWPEAEGVFNTPWALFAAALLVFMPLPYLSTLHEIGDPFDYERLFANTCSFIALVAVALLFTFALWLLIWLADTLLRGVGQRFLGEIFIYGVVPYLVTGAAFGFAMAISREFAAQNPSLLGLWLLRLLLPVLAGFSTLFIAVALVSGFDEAYFPDFTLLLMAALGLLLCTLAVERAPAKEVGGPLRACAKLMGGLAAAMALMGLWALNLQLPQKGWSPDRIAEATIAVVLLLYGLGHVWSLALARNWGQGVRRANQALAGLVYLLAFLWLTPLFDAESLSARSALRAYEEGRLTANQSPQSLGELGHAGRLAREKLLEQARERKDQSMIAQLTSESSGNAPPDAQNLAELIEELRVMLPVSPASATATRDSYLMLMRPWELEDILNGCAILNEVGQPGCVMVVGDLLPHVLGEEVVLALDRGGWISIEGLFLEGMQVERRTIRTPEGRAPSPEEARGLIAQWQNEPPPIVGVEINQIGTGSGGLFFAP